MTKLNNTRTYLPIRSTYRDQLVICYIVTVHSGEYDCVYENIESVWLSEKLAKSRAEKINAVQRKRHYKNRAYAEVSAHTIST